MRLLPLFLVAILLAGCATRPAPSSTHHSLPWHLLDNQEESELQLVPFYVDGEAPNRSAIQAALPTILDLTNKEKVTFAEPQELTYSPEPDKTWYAAGIQAIYSSIALAPRQGVVQIAVFYLEGKGMAWNSTAAGLSKGEWIAVFPDTFRNGHWLTVVDPISIPYPDQQAREQRYETFVLLHEVGHSIGLVNNGIPMQTDHVERRDACLCHSKNQGSIMYTGFETKDFAHQFIGSAMETTKDFDAEDRGDVRAFQASLRAGST